jgi:hypothetical protein
MGREIDRAKIFIKWEFTMLVGGEEDGLSRSGSGRFLGVTTSSITRAIEKMVEGTR